MGGRPGERGDRSGGGALFVYDNSFVMMVGLNCPEALDNADQLFALTCIGKTHNERVELRINVGHFYPV